MTEQELKLELLRVAKAQSPHEMGSSPLEIAQTYYQWITGEIYVEPVGGYETMLDHLYKQLGESDNMAPPLKQQVQSIVKTAQSEIQEIALNPPNNYYWPTNELQIYKNAFNKLLEL